MKRPALTRTRLLALVGLAAAGMAAALIAVSLTGSGDEGEPPAVVAGSAEVSALLDGIPQRGIVLGRADAPVTLVEYADLQCPYCATWASEAFPAIVREYVRPGKVRLVFRGLAFIGPDSEEALRAALSAGEQGRLWHVVELLYVNQGTENSGWVSDGLLRAVGAAVPGFDVERMLDGRDSPACTAQMRAAERAAEAAGIQGTPSFEVGRTGGPLRRLEIATLDAGSVRPALDRLLAS